MSTLYFIDAHTPVLANSQIHSVLDLNSGSLQMNGSFVVRVPFGVTLTGNPSDLTSLLTKKYAGLLASYPGYTNIVYDDLLDTTGINVASCSKASLGSRGSISMVGTGGVIRTNTTVLGASPSEVIVTWEVFGINVETPQSTITTRAYTEYSTTDVTVDVSFNAGATFNTVLDGTLLSVPPADQGPNLVLRFTNNAADRRWLGSWAVIYG